MRYWLMKSEPDVFSIADLQKRKIEPWEGVRNYQARNYLRDMRLGDLAFFYHSNCNPPAIVGIMQVVKEAYPDPTALDPESPYYDPKCRSSDSPRWYMVDVAYQKTFPSPLVLQTLKADPQLADFPLVRKGNRLSIMPVSSQQWQRILSQLES